MIKKQNCKQCGFEPQNNDSHTVENQLRTRMFIFQFAQKAVRRATTLVIFSFSVRHARGRDRGLPIWFARC